MSDTSPQTVLGFDPDALRAIVQQELDARQQEPGRLSAAGSYLAARLAEPSTRSNACLLLAGIVGIFGYSLSGEMTTEIAGALALLGTLLGIFTKEGGSQDKGTGA